MLFCAAAVAQPVTDSLRLGQSTTILLLGFALVAYGEVFGRPWLGGIGMGIAILDKLFPGALLLFFLWRGRYRLCAATAAFVVLLTVVTLPVTGLGMYGAFVQALQTYSNQPNAGPVNLSPFHALIVGPAALLRPGQPEPVSGMLPLVATLLCVALFSVALLAQGWPDVIVRIRRARSGGPNPLTPFPWREGGTDGWAGESSKDARRARLFAVSWAVCSLLALEPIDWIFYYLLLLIPLAWLLTRPDRAADGGQEWPGARRWWMVGLLAYFVATLPLPLDPRTAPAMSAAFVAGICVRPAALLVLWATHAAFAYARRPMSTADAAAPVADRTAEAPERAG